MLGSLKMVQILYYIYLLLIQYLKQVELQSKPLIINERHAILLQQTVDCLKNINFQTMSVEIIAEELRIAIDRIGQITGQVYTDDVLDNIFSKFCIGK